MLPERLCKTQIFHGLLTEVWSISESIMDVPQVLLDGFELSSIYIASSKPGCGSKIIIQTLPKRLCKIQIFHGLSTQVWSISESIMAVTQVLLDGFELSSTYIASSKPGCGSKIIKMDIYFHFIKLCNF